MATKIIPWPLDSIAFKERVVLDGVPYKLHFRWNVRGNFWSMTIKNTKGVALISGVKLVYNYPLIGRYKGRDLPPGEMRILRGESGDDAELARHELFNKTANLIYHEA